MQPEEKKPTFCIVTAKEVVYNQQLSWKFLFSSGMDYAQHRKLAEGNWGHLFDSTEDGKTSVLINILNKDNKLILGWGNESFADDWLQELMREMPSCSILMKQEYAEKFKAKCDELGYAYYFHCFDGTLTTR